MDVIALSTKKQIDTYMNPQRQRLLRAMDLAGVPMTPKELSVKLGISPSSVQYHIGRLVELGVVALHHTAQVRGITAKYYALLPVVVRFYTPGGAHDERVVLEKLVADVMSGYLEAHGRLKARGAPLEQVAEQADLFSGVVYLDPGEGRRLSRQILDFIEAHSGERRPGQRPWEYALVAYDAGEGPDGDG